MAERPASAELPPTVADVRAVLQQHYPDGSAESWDRVGAVTGDPDDPVRGILLTVDVTDAVIEQAVQLDANLIIAHHPLLLRGVNAIDPRHPKGRMITALIRSGIALITAHTNADVPAGGVSDALARALGLQHTRPLRSTAVRPLDKLITYVPDEHRDTVIDALAAAGAGTIGDYRRCAFSAAGSGTYEPQPGARPTIGTVGERETVDEQLVEMIMERSRRSAVLDALRSAHPYQEPAYQVIELAAPGDAGPTAGMGRIGTIEPTTLAGFAQHVAAVLPETASGIRVAGDPDRMIETVAVQGGAGDDLLDVARGLGADVYLTSDLRHHPATEAIAWTAAPALIDVSHWAAEWTWLPLLQQELASRFGATSVTVSDVCTDAWNFVVHR